MTSRLDRGRDLGRHDHPLSPVKTNGTSVLVRPTGFKRADAICIRIPIESGTLPPRFHAWATTTRPT